ncbi:putative ribonuclease H-like domain-containing protein [Tanacetum coccineum]
MQKYILKQQFEGFTVSNSEGLHKGYDRFQCLLSQLETHGAGVSNKDANQKFLRSLPSTWSQVSLVMRTKPGLDTLSFDDLYNNLRVFKSDVKGSTASTSNSQNVAFISSKNTNSTNVDSTAYSVSSSSGNNSQKENSSSYTGDLLHSFFANQSTSPKLDHDDLEQINDFDLEEMDLKWQVAMISMRLKKFYKQTRRKLHFDAKEPVGFDKTKVECYNCHKTRHFAIECRSKGNQDARRREAGNSGYKAKDNGRRLGKQEEPKAMVTIDGEGIDWTAHAGDEQEDFAFMAFNNSNSEVNSCSKQCVESYTKLKKLYDEQRVQLNEASIEIKAYAQDLDDKTNVLAYHKKLLAEALKEKVELKTKVENWHSSKNLGKLLNTQMSANDKFGLGYGDHRYDGILSYENEVLQSVFMNKESELEKQPLYDRFVTSDGMHVVPPPMTGNYMPSGPDVEIDDSKFTYGPKQPITSESETNTSDFSSCESESSVESLECLPEQVVKEPKVACEPKVWTDAPIIEEYESDSDDDCVSIPLKEIEQPSFAVDSDKHVKTSRENVKDKHTHSQYPKVNKKDLNESKRVGLGYGFTRRACFVCGSFSHLIRDCDYHEKRMAKQVELNKQKMAKGNGSGESKPKWNNVQRMNHQNQFVPRADGPQRALKNKGIVDSGCSRHMTGNKAYLVDYEDYNGGHVAFGGSKGHITGRVPRQHNMYTFSLEIIIPSGGLACLLAKSYVDESNKWHRRLGHVNFKTLNKLVKGNLVRGLPSKTFQNDHTCVACQKGKQHKASCKAKVVSSISQPLQLLHMDLFRPTSVRSINHKTYCLVITNDFSRFSWVFFLRTKDETSSILKDFIRQIENQLNKKVKTIRCDNGTEFKNMDMIEFCGSKGIKREYSNARTPQQNGVTKRKNRTLIEAARTMLADSFLPNTFWAEAVSTACYVLNRVFVTKPHNKTPYELITGKLPIISYIRPFGCHMTILNTIDHLGKFEEKANEGFLVGYSLSSKAFRVYNLETKRVEENLHIRFLENKPNVAGKGPTWLFDLDYLTDSMKYQPVTTENTANKPAGTKEDNQSVGVKIGSKKLNEDAELKQEKEANDVAEVFRQEFAQGTEDLLLQEAAIRASSTNIINTDGTPVSTDSPSGIFGTDGPYANQDDSQIPALEDIYGNPSNGIFTNVSYDDEGAEVDFTNLESNVNVSPIPTSRIHTIHPTTQILGDPSSTVQTRSKVNKSLGAHALVDAMQEELLQFKIQDVWILVDLRFGKKAIAQGHRKEEGIDYDEVFAPVARIEAIRIFLAFASYMGFIVYQMDVKSTFLYGSIDEEVYVSQPLGFVDPKFPNKNRYRRGAIDKTLFIKKDKKDIMLVQVYVDDIIFGSTKKSWCDEFEVLMKSKFQMSSMRELTFFIGLQVKQHDKGIFISQDKYVAEILTKFDFMSVKHASTPIETHKPLVKDKEGANGDVHLYRSMIGSLMYLNASRPDIMFAVCACSRFQVTPKTSHLKAVKRIFRYLKGKPKLGLWYPRESSFDLVAFSDSDYGGASLDRKSTIGGCQFFSQRLISWQCKKQTIVATSTTEAEYVAAAHCFGQVLWIQNQMLDYGFNFMNTRIYIDNESTICIVKNPVFHSKTKHIEIRHHFIRDAYEKKLIQVLKIHTDDNVADLLTKAFDIRRHNFLVVSIGMINQYDALFKGRLHEVLYSLYGTLSKQEDIDHGDVFQRFIWVLESIWREL